MTKSFYLLLIIIAVLVSCKKDRNVRSGGSESILPEKEKFQFQKVEFFNGDSSRATRDSVRIFSRTIDNNSVADVDAVVELPDQAEISEFSAIADSITLDESASVKFAVPILISADKIVTGNADWTFSPGVRESVQTALVNQKLHLKVEAKTRQLVTVYAKRQKLSSAYKATLTGNVSGKAIIITGVWHGIQLTGFSNIITSSNL